MVTITLFQTSDLQDIHRLLMSNRWEYFLDPVVTVEGLKKRDEVYFSSKENVTLVCRNEEKKLLGIIRFFEIENDETSSPDFTIYIDEKARNKGIGKRLLTEGIKHIFATFSHIRRIEATTRGDNIPMQKLFESVGFVKEAHYRKEWKNRESGKFMDAFGYALLKEEFDNDYEGNSLNK